MDDPLTGRDREPGRPPRSQADPSRERSGHAGRETTIKGFRQQPYDSVTISATDLRGRPEVNVYAFRLGGESAHLWLSPEVALGVALLVETLAGASKRQHQQVAAAMREAAAAVNADQGTPAATPGTSPARPRASGASQRRRPVAEPPPGTPAPQAPDQRL